MNDSIITFLRSFIEKLKSASTLKKSLFVLIVTAVTVFLLCSCSHLRTISYSRDDMGNVSFNSVDSTTVRR